MALFMARCFGRVSISRSFTPLLSQPRDSFLALSATGLQGYQKNVFHTSPRALQEKVADKAHGSQHWMNERYLSLALLGLIPAGIAYPSPPVDWALALILPLHNYWGMNQVFTDYIHGETLPGVVKALWAGVSVLTVVGLAYLNYNDVGVCKVIALTLNLK